MIATKTQLFVALVAAVVVTAQGTTTDTAIPPSGTDGISPCILGCITTAAASSGCTSFADLPCVCTSASFQTAAGACLTTTCTADEVAQALALQASQCGAVSTGDTTTATDGTTTDTTATDTAVTTTPTTSVPTTTRPTTSPTSTRTTPTTTSTGTASSPAATTNAASGQGRQASGVVAALVGGVLGLML